MMESKLPDRLSPPFPFLSLLLAGTGVALAAPALWLLVYVFEGARLGYYSQIPFTAVAVGGTVLIRCVVSIIGLFTLLAWSLGPGLLVLRLCGVRMAVKHVMTAILAVLAVLAFTGVMVRFFAGVFLASGVALLIVQAANFLRRKFSCGGTVGSSSFPFLPTFGDPAERLFARIGLVLRTAAILLLAAFVAGRDAALHQERYLVRQGAQTAVVLADQGDKLLLVDSLGSPKAQISFVSKAAPDAQGFTLERVGPYVLPFGIWNTPRGHRAWTWARHELQEE